MCGLFQLCVVWGLLATLHTVSAANYNQQNDGGYVGECYNGGSWFEGGCVCPPDYTGVQCGTKLFFDISRSFAMKQETTFHRISKRSIEECSGFGSGSGSGSGAGSGSGVEPEEEEIKCSGDQTPVNGRCEFARMFEGKLVLNKTFVEELNDVNSQQFKDLSKETECLIDRIFDEVSGYAGSKVTGFSDGIEVDFVIHLSESTSVTLSELSDSFRARITELDLKNFAEFESLSDTDECTTTPSLCDVNSVCVNTEGSFTCDCVFGYTNSASMDKRSGSSCRHVCVDEEDEPYCMNGGECFLTVNGTGVCTCERQYQGLRCERHWHIFLELTIGLGAALGGLLVIFVVVTLMLWARSELDRPAKSNFVELESNSANGDFTPTNEANEVKGISNPYVSSDEGITVATNQVDDGAPEVEDDRL